MIIPRRIDRDRLVVHTCHPRGFAVFLSCISNGSSSSKFFPFISIKRTEPFKKPFQPLSYTFIIRSKAHLSNLLENLKTDQTTTTRCLAAQTANAPMASSSSLAQLAPATHQGTFSFYPHPSRRARRSSLVIHSSDPILTRPSQELSLTMSPVLRPRMDQTHMPDLPCECEAAAVKRRRMRPERQVISKRQRPSAKSARR